MKNLVIFFLLSFFGFGVQAKNNKKANLPDRMGRLEYVQRVRSQIFRASPGNDSVKAPARMGKIEYKQKTRAQIINMSEEAGSVKFFNGLLINSKIGRNEKATFVISNRFVDDVPYCFVLDPQSEYLVSLPAGEYLMEIYCGNYYKAHIFHVDPRRTHYISGRTLYFAAEKSLSDF